jgi:hypothetical protein
MKLDDYLKQISQRPSVWAVNHNISPSIISRLLRGKTKPSLGTARKIIDATNGLVSISDICNDANS